MKKKQAMWMWLVVAVVALAALFLVDFSKYFKRDLTDEEVDSLGTDVDTDILVDEDFSQEYPNFLP